MSDKLKQSSPSSRDSTMEAKNTVEIPLTDSSDEKEQGGTTPKKPSSCDWGVLRSYAGGLKMGQVVAGIVVLGLEYPKSNAGTPDYILFFVILNVTLVTLVVLANALMKSRPIEKPFGTKLWTWAELRFTGLVALILHCLAYWVLIRAINLYWTPAENVIGSVFAFVASALYLADWWRLFSTRAGQ